MIEGKLAASADAVAPFFTSLGYNTGDRTGLTAEVREQFSKDPSDRVREYASQVLEHPQSVKDVFSKAGLVTLSL